MGKHKGNEAVEATVRVGDYAQLMADIQIIDESIKKHPIPPPTVTEENPTGKKVKKC